MNLSELEFNISEIFYSIQGEGTRMGERCIFVRMQGCLLRCSWCDTPYALDLKHQEIMMNGIELYNQIKQYQCKFVEFTGGEPLEQPNIIYIINKLLDEDYTVAIETAGYKDISILDKKVIKIMDIKYPDSNMSNKNNYRNIDFLSKNDEIKFVIASEKDYLWAKELIYKYRLDNIVNCILFSPAFGIINYKDLAEWILRDNLNVRFQIQLHKYIWTPDTRGV